MKGNIFFAIFGALYLGLGVMHLSKLRVVIPARYSQFEGLDKWQRSWGLTNVFAGILSFLGFFMYNPALFSLKFPKTIAVMILLADLALLIANVLYFIPSARCFSPYDPAFSRIIQIIVVLDLLVVLVSLSLCAGKWLIL